MSSCHKRSYVAGKITFVTTLAAAMISLCSGSASKVQEDEAVFKETIQFSEIEKIQSVMSEATVETTKTQLVKQNSVDTEECIVQEIVEIVGRNNNLYYIVDEGCRLDVLEEWQDYLWSKCVEYDITEYYELLFAQIYHESSWNPEAVSGTNDYGLMQINEKNHEWLKDVLGITDFLDPYESMDAGVYMMSLYLEKYNDAQTALVCYNMGEGKVLEGITSSKYSNGIVEDMDKLFILEEEEGK